MKKQPRPGEPTPRKSYLIDMDGVIVAGNALIAGAREFIDRLTDRGRSFLILTNNPLYTPPDLQHRLQAVGLRHKQRYVVQIELAN